jgi:hypothetical protein
MIMRSRYPQYYAVLSPNSISDVDTTLKKTMYMEVYNLRQT